MSPSHQIAQTICTTPEHISYQATFSPCIVLFHQLSMSLPLWRLLMSAVAVVNKALIEDTHSESGLLWVLQTFKAHCDWMMTKPFLQQQQQQQLLFLSIFMFLPQKLCFAFDASLMRASAPIVASKSPSSLGKLHRLSAAAAAASKEQAPQTLVKLFYPPNSSRCTGSKIR